MSKHEHKFTVIDTTARYVLVRVSSSSDGGENWETNGILTFTTEEWQSFMPPLLPHFFVIDIEDEDGQPTKGE